MTRSTFCDGLARRDFLRLGVFGAGLSLPGLLAASARAAEQGKPTRDVSLIFVFLHGGLSTIDTWDMKPDAPAEFRGEFKPADMCAGHPNCDLLPHREAAGQVLARALVPPSQLDHGPADHYIITGYFPTAGSTRA
jgi:uncharacterized protein (DUF1501 family)